MRIYLTVGLLVSCILFGCKKPHDGSSNQTPCETLPKCNSVLDPEYYTSDTVWMCMSLNPSSSNEIATWKFKAGDLVRRNTVTGATNSIIPVTRISSIRWGQDWIVYNRWKSLGYGEIYKIKPDGSGNQLLTEGYYSFRPEINPAGTLFLHFKLGKIEIFDMDGNHIKETVPPQTIGDIPYDWFTDELLLSYSPASGIYLTNVYTGTVECLITNPNETGDDFGCPVFIGNDEFVWTYEKGLMKTNLQTRETVPFLPSCTSVVYFPISYDAAQDRILCTKMHLSNLENKPCKIFSQTEVVWIDATSAKETIVSMDNL